MCIHRCIYAKECETWPSCTDCCLDLVSCNCESQGEAGVICIISSFRCCGFSERRPPIKVFGCCCHSHVSAAKSIGPNDIVHEQPGSTMQTMVARRSDAGPQIQEPALGRGDGTSIQDSSFHYDERAPLASSTESVARTVSTFGPVDRSSTGATEPPPQAP
jgi:hypothetical protein